MRDQTAIAGIGQSAYGRFLPESQLRLGARALKAALEDAGLTREDIDGMAIHLGWPLGVDYDRVAESYGLDLRWVTQTWIHGRFVTSMIQQAAMALACGLASVVACFTAISFTRERQILGGPGDVEGNREEGGTHGEAPPYGLTAPAGGAANPLARHRELYKPSNRQLYAGPSAMSLPTTLVRETAMWAPAPAPSTSICPRRGRARWPRPPRRSANRTIDF